MSENKTLQEIVYEYINEKRAIGYKYIKNENQLLRMLDLHKNIEHQSPALTKELVLQWTEKKPHETETNRRNRISTIRGLAEYMQRMGYEAYLFPFRSTPYTESKYAPYIFTEKELADLFHVIDTTTSTKIIPFRQTQFSLMFRLLYGTGMRISEVVSFSRKDIDLVQGTVFIKQTKLGKERILPLSRSLIERSRDYAEKMRGYLAWNDSTYFFPNNIGNKYDCSAMYHFFRDYLWRAGISHGGRGKGPRIHDFRFTYAVHCLRNWVREGKDLTTALPYLSAYMGHVGPKSTQYYLRLTAELYPDIIHGLDTTYNWMIPEVNNDGEY
jgi:integrase